MKSAGNGDTDIKDTEDSLVHTSANFAELIKMPHNPNPLTPLQERFMKAIRKKLIQIRNPYKDVEDYKSFEFYLEHTKKLGTIPKLKFRPNSLAVKEKIMAEVGYMPFTKKDHWRARRNAAASTFDKHWDNLMFRLVKAGRMIAHFNQMFSEEGKEFSDLLKLVQCCIEPEKIEGTIYPKDSKSVKSLSNYAEELANIK